MCVCVRARAHRDDFGNWGGFWRIGRDCRITKYIKTMKDDTSVCVCARICLYMHVFPKFIKVNLRLRLLTKINLVNSR